MRRIYRFPWELVGSNMYFIPSGETGIVIDPNENNDLLLEFRKYGTKKIVIVLTHEHYDHTLGVKWLQSKIESTLFCHKACAEVISTENGNNPKRLGSILSVRDAFDGGHRYDTFMSSMKHYALQADSTFEGESELVVGDIKLKCFSTPGHSPGSATYILDDEIVFTGDSLIQNTPTILRLPESNHDLYNQITKPFLKSLDPQMMVYPGHEAPFTLNEAKYL